MGPTGRRYPGRSPGRLATIAVAVLFAACSGSSTATVSAPPASEAPANPTAAPAASSAAPAPSAAPSPSAEVDIGWTQNPRLVSLEGQPAPNVQGAATVWADQLPALTQADLDTLRARKLTIGISESYATIPYFQRVIFGVKTVLDQAGVTLITTDANLDVNKQISDIDSLIARNVDALSVMPTAQAAINAAGPAAKKAGIPFVAWNFVYPTDDPFPFFGPSLYSGGLAGGEAMCKYLGDRSPKPGVGVFEYPGGADDGRREGFLKGIAECGLSMTAFAEAITQAEGLKAFTDMLTAHPDIRGAWGYYDGVTFGALQAFKAAGITDGVITSHDLGAEQTALAIAEAGSMWKGTAADQMPLNGEILAKALLLNILGKWPVAGGPKGVTDAIPFVDTSDVATWYEALFGEPLSTASPAPSK